LVAAPDYSGASAAQLPESAAVFLNPSASYVISEDWNASISSAYDVPMVCIVSGEAPRDWTIQQNAVPDHYPS
jgi:hypothetical protein